MGRLPHRTLRGIQVADERALAGRLNGIMYVVAAASTAAIPLLPGIDARADGVFFLMAALAALWGLIALRLDWSRTPGWLPHATSIAGIAAAALAMALTGGAGSPARFLLLFPLVYPSYFYPPAEARPYLVAIVAVWASPLLYDAAAVDGGALAELVIGLPALWMASHLLIEGKREMVALRARADDLARHDPLTGLANRRALLEALERHLASRRAGDRVGLLMVDVDDFKQVNTVHGHPAGDRALVAVADALRACAREEDLAARLGGDEFAIVVRGADPDGMATLAQRVLATVRETPSGVEDHELRVSAGWAMGGEAQSADALLVAADGALRRVKAHGKDAALGAGA
jgi:diguanylate cyclase (GGDEF)-like protein